MSAPCPLTRTSFPRLRPAFTAIEVLVVLGLLAASIGLSVPLYDQYRARSDVHRTIDAYVQLISIAKGTAQKGSGYRYGVEFATGDIFTGDSYDTRVNERHEYDLPASVQISGLTEITFSCNEGLPSVTGYIRVESRVISYGKRIDIDQNGFVALAALTDPLPTTDGIALRALQREKGICKPSAGIASSSSSSSLPPSQLCTPDMLYAGATKNNVFGFTGAQWGDFGMPGDGATHLASYNGLLYASADQTLYRCTETGWSSVATGSAPITSLGVHAQKLYYGMYDGSIASYDGIAATPAGAIAPSAYGVTSLQSYDTYLYAAGEGVYRLTIEGGWTRTLQVVGFLPIALGTHEDKLYAGGGSSACSEGLIYSFDGTAWTLAGTLPGRIQAIMDYNDTLFVGGTYGENKMVRGYVSRLEDGQWIFSGENELSVNVLSVYNDQLYAGVDTGTAACDCGMNTSLPALITPPHHTTASSESSAAGGGTGTAGDTGGGSLLPFIPKAEAFMGTDDRFFDSSNELGPQCMQSIASHAGEVTQYDGGTAWRSLRSFTKPVTALTAFQTASDGVFPACTDPFSAPTDPPVSVSLTDQWVTDGSIYAMARAGSTLYLGGQFTRIGPNTGKGVPLSTSTALPASTFPRINGPVYAVQSDGVGGWYVGGSFSIVGGQARKNLAYVRASGAVDSQWKPSTNGPVRAIAKAGTTVYIGGDFTTVNDSLRSNAAAIDPSGADTGVNFRLNGTVRSIAVSATKVAFGGDFTFGNPSAPSRYVAVFNFAGGEDDISLSVPSPVYVLTFKQSNRLFIGGDFGLQENGTILQPASTVGSVRAIAFDGNTTYVGNDASASAIPSLLKLNNGGNIISAWNNALPNGPVHSLAVAASTLYVGGEFSAVGGTSRKNLAAITDTGNGTVTSWNPIMSDAVHAIAVLGSTLYAAGDFSTAGGYERRNAAAIDITSDTVLPWDPSPTVPSNPDDSSVTTMAIDGSRVYLGGNFARVKNDAHLNFVAVNGTSGTPESLSIDANAPVNAVAVRHGTVYLGGYFTSIAGEARSYAAAFTSNGAVIDWLPSPDAPVTTIAVDGCSVFVGGYFSNIGGASRMYLASVDPTEGTASAWNPDPDSWITTLAVRRPTLYIGGLFNRIANAPRSNLAAVSVTTGSLRSWRPDPNGAVWSIAPTASTVVLGGTFTTLDGHERRYIGSVSASTGRATSFDPTADAIVSALAVSGNDVFAGGGFSGMASFTDPKPYFSSLRFTTLPASETGICKPPSGSALPSISADGMRIAFTAPSSIVPTGSNGGWLDTFVYDRRSGEVRRVSVSTDGTPAIDYQSRGGGPSISADGRYVAFLSDAKLLQIDTNAVSDIYVYDLQTNQLTLASVSSSGVIANAQSTKVSISPDGRYLAFLSNATNLTIDGASGVFLKNLQTGAVTLLSRRTNGVPATGSFGLSARAVSGGGQSIVFTATDGNLVAGDTNGWEDVFVYNATSGTISVVNISSAGAWPNARTLPFISASISDDGSTVIFNSEASNLVSGDTNNAPDIFIHTLASHHTTRVSLGTDGQQLLGQIAPATCINGSCTPNTTVLSSGLSEDGRLALFTAYPTDNLYSCGYIKYAGKQAFLHDTVSGTTSIVSISTDGANAATELGTPTLSADGAHVAFVANDGILPGDANSYPNVYVRDLDTGITEAGDGPYECIGSPPSSPSCSLPTSSAPSCTDDPIAAPLHPNDEVHAMSAANGRVYIGGLFTDINQVERVRIAAVDEATGNDLPCFAPIVNGPVYAIEAIGTTVYIGGRFTSVNGQPRNNVAALNAVTGQLLAWNPSVTGVSPEGTAVYALEATSAGMVYIGGVFTQVGGMSRQNAAAVDSVTGVLQSWNPQLSASSTIRAIKIGAVDTLYLGGYRLLRAVDPTTGATQPAWNPRPTDTTSDTFFSIDYESSSHTVYVGGDFTSLGPAVRRGIASIDGTTGVVMPWNAGIDAEGFSAVRTIAMRDRLYIGGAFASIQGQSRSNVSSFEKTGTLSTWNPGADSAVFSLARGNEKLFLGGKFQTVAGRDARRFAQISFSQTSSDACVQWPSGASQMIIDNGRLGYQEAGNPWSTGTLANFGTQPRVASVNADNETQSATWCFSGVPPGEYAVRTTWPSTFNNARSALYTMRLSTDPQHPQEGRVNQANPPRSDAQAGGAPFQTLGVVRPPSTGSVIVSLSNKAATNGFPTYSATVFADAAWLARTTPCIADGTNTAPAMSADGRYVAFVSAATNLISGDGNNAADIFVFDTVLSQLSRVSVSMTGGDADGHSSSPSISADGRYVTFSSAATNLVTGDTNGKADVFVFDRQTSATTRISMAYDASQANGDSGSPSMSADGRFVAFASLATNLVTGDTNGRKDIFIFDRTFGTVSRASLYGNGSQTTSDAFSPTISADGRFVAYFTTGWSGQEYFAQYQVVLYDRTTGAVSYAVRSATHDTNIYGRIALSADGRYVFYSSSQKNLFLFDRVSGTTNVVRSNAWNPSVSSDGRYVAFAASVTSNGTTTTQAYLLDTFTGSVSIISTNQDASLLAGADTPSISADARFVTFAARGFAPERDVIVVKDLQIGSLDPVSVPASCAGGSSSLSITDVAVTGITPTSATVTWKTSSAADTLVQYGESTAYGTSTPSQPTPLVTSHSVTLTGLSPSTLYHVVAISANASGRAISPDVTFSTHSTSSAFPCVAGFPSFTFLSGLWEANGPVRAVVRSDNIVYIGGDFTSVSGQPRYGLAAIDASTGQVTPWNPGTNAPVHALALLNGTLYVGGKFTQVGNQSRTCLAAVNSSNGIVLPWNPGADGMVRTLLPVTNRLIVGGNFDAISGSPTPRLAALDATTGMPVVGWDAQMDTAGTVYDLASDGTSLFIGGDFDAVGGNARNNLASVTLLHGSLNNWIADTDGIVRALAIDGNRLLIGGSFTTVSGATRQRLAAVNTGDASLFSWNPGLASSPTVHDIFVQSGLAYVGGGVFGTIGGASKNSALVAIDAVGSATSWNPAIRSGEVYALFIASGAGYAGGTFQQLQGQQQRNFSPVSLINGSFDATPPVISSLRATAIGCTEATIEWNTHELSDSQVEYGPTSAYGSSSPLPTPLTLNHSVVLSSLRAQSTYHFRVKSKDAAGNLGVSSDTTFSTADCTAPVITNVRVTALTHESATITWTTNEPADTQVTYGTTTAYGSFSPLNTALVTAHSVQITGLTSQTLYHFGVKSKDGAGNLATSPDATFTTLDAAPPVISGVSVSDIRCNSATITWTTNEPANTQVAYGTTTAYGSWSPLNGILVTAHSVQITGLTSQTLYHFSVKSTDAAGNFALSPDATFTTSDCNAPIISNVRVINLSFNAARVVWDTAELADSQVEYGLTASYGAASALPTAFVTAHGIDLASLSPGTLYHFRVKSRDSFGNLGVSSDYTVTTLSANFSEANGFGLNGSVYAIAQSSDTTYVGGDFTEIGSYTGRGIMANAANAVPQPVGSFPLVNGPVYASIPDGRGGWYIGGDFTRVGGLPRSTLAHITRDGTIDTLWNGSTNGTNRAVRSLALSDDRTILYVGGEFTAVNGSTSRSNLAAFSALNGSVAGLNIAANGPVNALLVRNDRLYVGGSFSSLGGTARSRIGSIVLSTSTLDSGFAPSIDSGGEVMTLAWSDQPFHQLLVGGTFTSVGGMSRTRFASLHPVSGAVLDAAIDVAGSLTGGPTSVQSIATLPGTQRAMFRSSVDMSSEGRYMTYAGQLDGESISRVYLRDAVTESTSLVSLGSGNTDGNDSSLFPTISADGRFIAYESVATNLVTGDTNGKSDIFLYDRLTSTTTRISRSTAGTQSNGNSLRPTISADGRFIAYESVATNLVTGDTNGKSDIFLYDRETGQTTRVSVATSGTQGNGNSTSPAISGNGRYVAYWSDADSLVASDTNALADGFLRDVQTGQTTRFTVKTGGAQVMCPFVRQSGPLSPASLSLSTDGRYIVYTSLCDDIVPDDTDGTSDVFLFDRQMTTSAMVSTGCIGADESVDISGDGRFVAFAASQCASAAGTETNGVPDLFFRDMQSSEPILVPPSNLDGGNGAYISMSADARYVGFISTAAALGGDGSHGNIATYDRQTSALSALSRYFISDSVFIGGNFTTVGGYIRNGGARFSSLRQLAAWHPASDGPIASLVHGGSAASPTMYVGGTFTAVGGTNANGFAALDAITGTAYPWSINLRLPSSNGAFIPSVYTVSASGSIRLYLGGNFTTVNPFGRKRLAAFSTADGRITSWNPSVTGTAVSALKIIGSSLYVGGDFTMIGTQPRVNLGATTLDTVGSPTGWSPPVLNGTIETIDGNASSVYAGGAFTSVGGGGTPTSTRNHLAAFSTINGSLLAWNPNASGTVSHLVLNGAVVYLTGHAGTSVGGQSAIGAVALDATSGSRFGWVPQRDAKNMCIIGGTTYVAGSSMPNSSDATRLSSHNIVTGNATGLSISASGPITDVSCSDSLLFVGGDFSTLAGQTRNQLAVIDPTAGTMLSYWNPDVGDYGRSFKVIYAEYPHHVVVGDHLRVYRYAY